MTNGTNGTATTIWLKRETVAFVLQSVLILSSLIWGWASLSNDTRLNHEAIMDLRQQVTEVKQQITADRAMHEMYVRSDLWNTRNRFVDEKLDKIDRKLDILLGTRRVP